MRTAQAWGRACLLVVFAFCAEARAQTIQDVVSEVGMDSYTTFHSNLCVNLGCNRGFSCSTNTAVIRVPTNQHDRVRDYIASTFGAMMPDTRLDPFVFTYSKGGGTGTFVYSNCNNVVAVHPGLLGTNGDYYVIGAHYDSVDPGDYSNAFSPGADDNGSGVAAVLEAARVLTAYSFMDNLVFIAFDGEEKGLKGSAHYVATHLTHDSSDPTRIPGHRVRGMISLDMIAYNPEGSYHNRAYIVGGSSDPMTPTRTTLAWAMTNFTSLTVENSGSINQSDHAPFWTWDSSRRIDACLLIERAVWSNHSYHKTTDAVETPGLIDYTYAVAMTRGVVGYLCAVARPVLPLDLACAVPAGEVGRPAISWRSASGLCHTVEYRADLLTDAWHVLAVRTNVFGADTLSVTDAVSAVGQCFYRLTNRVP